MSNVQVWTALGIILLAYGALLPFTIKSIRTMGKVEGRLDTLDAKLSGRIDRGTDEMTRIRETMEEGFGNQAKLLDARLETVNSRIDAVGQSLTYIEKRLDV